MSFYPPHIKEAAIEAMKVMADSATIKQFNEMNDVIEAAIIKDRTIQRDKQRSKSWIDKGFFGWIR